MTSCTITLAPSGALALSIPSPSGRTQTVEVPCTVEGLRVIRNVLQDRAQEGPKTLGTRSEPTASQIAEFLAEQARDAEETKRRRIAAKAAAADEVLELIGLELDL